MNYRYGPSVRQIIPLHVLCKELSVESSGYMKTEPSSSPSHPCPFLMSARLRFSVCEECHFSLLFWEVPVSRAWRGEGEKQQSGVSCYVRLLLEVPFRFRSQRSVYPAPVVDEPNCKNYGA